MQYVPGEHLTGAPANVFLDLDQPVPEREKKKLKKITIHRLISSRAPPTTIQSLEQSPRSNGNGNRYTQTSTVLLHLPRNPSGMSFGTDCPTKQYLLKRSLASSEHLICVVVPRGQ